MSVSELRAQKSGKQHPWTLEELRVGLANFHAKHYRYPTANEVDAYPYLPSSRSIERRFGGLVNLRKQIGLVGQSDFRAGSHSTKRAQKINERAHKTEAVVHSFLIERFGKEFVHREYFFTDDKRTRADFFVYDSTDGFCVDVFYPNNRRNLTGCLNSKLGKYHTNHMRQYPVIFLQMNEELDQSLLNQIVANKKNPLLSGESLMSWETFKKFCLAREPLKALRRKRS